MSDRSKVIFGNPIAAGVCRKAEKKHAGYVKKYGLDAQADYRFSSVSNGVLTPELGVGVLELGQHGEPIDGENGVIVGNIRMGFGHYRISMAIASAARSMGLRPYWFDLLSFRESSAAKVIGHLNALYSLGSRLSQKFELFNRLYWEPLNSEGFKKLSFNAQDQKVAELFGVLCRSFPKEMPFLGTHVWPTQAAVHAGMSNVVNVVPDNWPMALHLAEGSLHAVQSPSAYMGYRLLREMGETRNQVLRPMPSADLRMVGHFIDHELVVNAEADVARRLERLSSGAPRRILLSVGGAGAQREFFAGLLRTILPLVRDGRATLLLNFGDHRGMWDALCTDVPQLAQGAACHFDDWAEASRMARAALTGPVHGVHAFVNKDIFAAVYLTNILMRAADVLVTKPSELAYYPVPKLFIKRVGGHEAWGAIRGAELGDGSIECSHLPMACQALELMVRENDLLGMQCESIVKLRRLGVYDGAYEAVRLAQEKRGKVQRS